VLADLRARIRNTRWPDPASGLRREQGTDLAYLRQVLAYWADGLWHRLMRGLGYRRYGTQGGDFGAGGGHLHGPGRPGW
jgi:hypothetical protein